MFFPLTEEFQAFLSLLLIIPVNFLSTPPVASNVGILFSIVKFVNVKAMKLWMGLRWVSNKVKASVRPHVQSFNLVSELNYFDESLSLVDFWFVVKFTLHDWSFDQLYWFPSLTFSYCYFKLSSSPGLLMTYSSSRFSSVGAFSTSCLLKHPMNFKLCAAVS